MFIFTQMIYIPGVISHFSHSCTLIYKEIDFYVLYRSRPAVSRNEFWFEWLQKPQYAEGLPAAGHPITGIKMFLL